MGAWHGGAVVPVHWAAANDCRFQIRPTSPLRFTALFGHAVSFVAGRFGNKCPERFVYSKAWVEIAITTVLFLEYERIKHAQDQRLSVITNKNSATSKRVSEGMRIALVNAPNRHHASRHRLLPATAKKNLLDIFRAR